MRTPLIAALLLLALSVPPASAAECNGAVLDIAGAFYVDDRAGELWIYQESNGVAGLQSGGRQILDLWTDDCRGGQIPDTLLY